MALVVCDRCQFRYEVRSEGPFVCPRCKGVGHSKLPVRRPKDEDVREGQAHVEVQGR